MNRSALPKTEFVFSHGGAACWEETGHETWVKNGSPLAGDPVLEADIDVLRDKKGIPKEKLLEYGFVVKAGTPRESQPMLSPVPLVYSEWWIQMWKILDLAGWKKMGEPKSGDWCLLSEMMWHQRKRGKPGDPEVIGSMIRDGSLVRPEASWVKELSHGDPKMDDWAELTQEEPREPHWPSIDPHHHLFAGEMPISPMMPPWLVNSYGPRQFQHFGIKELARDMKGNGVIGTVFMECKQQYLPKWPMEDPATTTAESAWVQSIASENPVPMAIVAHTDLVHGREVVARAIKLHREKAPNLVGFRQNLAWHPFLPVDSARWLVPFPLISKAPAFRDAVQEIGKEGLIFESWLYHFNLDELVELAAACPDTKIVCDSAGGPLGSERLGQSLATVMPEWRSKISALAKCKNTFVKLTGLGMPATGFGWERRAEPPPSEELAEAYMPWFDHCIKEFGASRCMFASNFPTDKASGSFTTLWNAYKLIAEKCLPDDEAAQRSLFYDTAVRVYGLDKPPFGLPATSGEAEAATELPRY